jgi:hypothetical protein
MELYSFCSVYVLRLLCVGFRLEWMENIFDAEKTETADNNIAAMHEMT